MRLGGIWLVVLSSVVAQAAPLPRELREVQPRIERETKRMRATVDAARRRVDKAGESLAQAEAALAEATDETRAKLTAARDKLAGRKVPLEARLAEAQKAAQPGEQAARALAAYAHGQWRAARDDAEAAKLPAAANELGYVGALARLRAGDWKEGVARLDQPALSGLGEAQRFLGVAKLRLGDAAAAQAHLERAHLAADDGEAHAALGEIYLGAKRIDAAAAELEKAVRVSPSDARLLGLLGRAQLELGRNADAAKTLERWVKLAPRDREAAYLEAVARSRAGDAPGAERALGRYLAHARVAAGEARYERPHLTPFVVPTYGFDAALPVAADEGSAHLQLAVWLAERGEYEQARRELEAAPADARGLYDRGLVERMAGRAAQARTALEKAARLDARPHAPQALGALALDEGDARAAEAAFREAARRAPADELPKLGLALSGAPAEADRLLAALAQKPGRVGAAARVDRAALALAAGAFAQARTQLGSDEDRVPEAAFVRGRVAEQEGAAEEAQAAYGRAVALAPNYFDALVGLGRVSEGRGDHPSARATLERAIAVQPNEAEPHALLGKALAGLGDEAAARAETDKAQKLDGNGNGNGNASASANAKKAHVVGVTAFDNTGKDAQRAWLSVAIAEALGSDLPKLGGLRVVERAQLQKAFDEVRLQQLAAVDEKSAPQLGKMVGADALVVGSFQIVGAQIRVLGRLVSVADGTVLRAGEATGALDALFDVERRLALDLVSDYAQVGAAERDAFRQAPAPSVAGLESVARAQVALAHGDTAQARVELARAEAADARFAAAFADLKKSAEARANAAVLPFTNASRRPDDEWLAGGIAEALSGDLRKLGVPQVERLAIDRVMQEKRFAELFADAGAAQQAGKQIGAKALIVGAYQSNGTSLRIDARLVDVESQKVLLADHIEGALQALFDLETQLAIKLGKQLNPQVSETDAAELADDHPPLADWQAKMQQRIAGDPQRVAREAPAHVAAQLAQTGVAWVPPAAGAAPPPPPPNREAVPAVVETRVVPWGGRLRIEGRVVDRRTGQVLASGYVDGGAGEAAALEGQLAQSLTRGLQGGAR